MAYKIKVLGPVEVFKTQYGDMKKYTLQFEGSDEWVKLNQKVDSPAPTVGQELEGTIEDTQYGKQFKKAQSAQGGGRSFAPDPATRASIERQSALKAAVDVVHNYSTTYGSSEKLDLKQYIVRVVNAASALSNAIEGKTIAAEAPKAEPEVEQDEIDLSDIPF